MAVTVARICRYPVKGLSAEPLDAVELAPGRRLPGDRRFAIARASAQIDATEPAWAPKSNFVTLVKEERLAQLDTAFDADTGQLTIRRGGKTVSQARITDPMGRMVISQFLAAFLDGAARGAPKLVDAGAACLTDVDAPFISIINLASVRDLERVAGRPVDPLRFRGNVYLEGLPPWAEADWVGETIGLGPARLHVAEPIGRCAATAVDPSTGERDLNIPKLLQRGYGHTRMGVYAEVTAGGTVRPGDPAEVPET